MGQKLIEKLIYDQNKQRAVNTHRGYFGCDGAASSPLAVSNHAAHVFKMPCQFHSLLEAGV